MELINEFRVGVPVEEAWAVLTDVERIAPCLPGAQLTEVDGETYSGNVKVKVGPITAQYKGTATFIEKDDDVHRAVLKADGRDTRGQGNASALVTATLVADGDGTLVTVKTDLTITGKVAQFGRGVLADVSSKLVGQFVQSLEADVLSGSAAPAVAPPSSDGTSNDTSNDTSDDTSDDTSTGPRKIDSKEAAPVDLLGSAGGPVAKRIAPIFGVLVVVFWLLRRRRKHGSGGH